ncbi:KAP family P-loop NTPase fold protein [Photobacterium damselae]|uniref:KAP family P-loop NTPase fold protein n=1 Tax=Photobacterium damselae TaxID=38293 RepID=UPI000E041BB1|nr:P-loop NTPase fold protein [Photobacterium damselae]SUB90244.1 Predicted P-loop ATPase [Photobacterium damselae]
MPISFNWSEPELNIDSKYETFPADQLDREKYAKFLTTFLAKQGYDDARDSDQKKRNYVLNLNAEWGSGKSYFLKRWAHDLKEHYPVVYIDAWKQDYSDDPLMTVISSMIKQLRTQAGKDTDKAIFKVSRKFVGLLKAAAPTLARGIATKYLGVDPLKIMEIADDKVIGENIDSDGKSIDMGLAAQKMVEHLISEHDSKAKAIESLKLNVEQWVEAVIGKYDTKSYPAFIFIDELDRCRPNYAVEMLETIKHIFNIPGVVFVVATDTEQLQHAVKAIYGEGFNAKQYLGRFFNSRYTFKAPSYEKLINVHCDVYKLSDGYLKQKEIMTFPDSLDQIHDDKRITLKNLTVVYDAFSLSARQVIQITDRLITTIDNMSNVPCLNIVYLAFLLCLREKDSELYDLVCKNKLDTQVKFNNNEHTLVNHIALMPFWKNMDITLYLQPVKIVDTFYTDQHDGYSNKWDDGIYNCKLLSFIKDIHHYLLSNQETRKSDIQRIYNDHARSLVRSNIERDYSNGQFWVKPAFDKLNPPSFDTSTYKGLVELASNLDHIDEE